MKNRFFLSFLFLLLIVVNGLYIGCGGKTEPLMTTPHSTSDLDSGLHLLDQNLYNQALPYLRSAVLNSPNSAVAYAALGWTCYKMGYISEAISAAEMVLHLEPNTPNLPLLIYHLRQDQNDLFLK